MASERAILWTERLVWILLYGGLLTVVIGLAAFKRDEVSAWALIGVGSVVAATGAVLIWVRSRMQK